MRGEKALNALYRAGFVFDRQESSHVTVVHPQTDRSVTVPVHSGKDLPPGTLRRIIRDAGLTVEQFLQFAR